MGVGEKAVGRDMEKSYTCFEASYNLQKQGIVAGQLVHHCINNQVILCH